MKPMIYVFSNVKGGGKGICYAMAEDGTVLGSHWCSNEGFAPYDLGIVENYRPDRRETYAKHYPDGFDMEFVPADAVKTHEGLRAAFALNQKQAEAAKQHSAERDFAQATARPARLLAAVFRGDLMSEHRHALACHTDRGGKCNCGLQDHIDAERYRWIRAHGSCPFAETDDAWDTADKLDAAIDARMSESPSGSGS